MQSPPLQPTATAGAVGLPPPAKKPWRFYYVLAFPLHVAMSKDKLTSILELTASIERREEAFLAKMADRHCLTSPPPHSATTAPASVSPLPAHVSRLLTWLCLVVVLAAIVGLAAIYWFQGDVDVDRGLVDASNAVLSALLALNLALYGGVTRDRAVLVRVLFGILIGVFVGSLFLLDQLRAIQFSQETLASALERRLSLLTDEQVQRILNGGVGPSLWHRFLVDGPAWYLLRLESHCATAEDATNGEAAPAPEANATVVDSDDYFAKLWDPTTRRCARRFLHQNAAIESVVYDALWALACVVALQLVLMGLLLWAGSSGASLSPGAGRKRRRRPVRKTPIPSRSPPSEIGLLSSVIRLARLGLIISGGIIVITGVALLSSCAFVGPMESWSLVLAAIYGLVLLTLGLQDVATVRRSLLIAGVALDSLVSSSLRTLCRQLTRPSSAASTQLLRDAYDLIFYQSCQPMRQWRAHVCVSVGAPASPHGKPIVDIDNSLTCRSELAGLLVASSEHLLVFVMGIMAAKLVLLVWLLVPSIMGTTRWVVSVCCCIERGDGSRGGGSGGGGAPGDRPKSWKQATLDYSAARQTYLSTLRHPDATRVQAESAAFEHEWRLMSGRAHGDVNPVIFSHQFEAIVRSLVIRRLTERCKLDLSLSLAADGRAVLVKVAASDNLLMTTLCRSADYKLQVADAIDPGPRFWRDPRELRADAKVLDLHTIRQKFKLLLQHGVVSRKEAEVLPGESLAQASARVQALTRQSRARHGAVVCANPHPAFAPYSPQLRLQFLFKKYPHRLEPPDTPLRRAAVLRTVDALRLTRRILDAELNVDQMLRRGLLTAFGPLHSASRYDTVSRESLRGAWVAFWRPVHLPGEWRPETQWLLNRLGRLSPFRQPLQDIRDYFGESVAFYFAWLAAYNRWLLLPAAGALVLQLVAGDDATAPVVVGRGAFGITVVAWGYVFAKMWERESVGYQLQWGMQDHSDAIATEDRANFQGITRRNPITQQLEVHFPGAQRLRRQIASGLLLIALGALHVYLCGVVFLAQGVIVPWLGLRAALVASAVVLALLVQWNGELISSISHRLSEWENYQSEAAFQRAVVLKVFGLQVLNTYAPLLAVAFGYRRLGELRSVVPLGAYLARAFDINVRREASGVVELRMTLLVLFITRTATHIALMLQGLIRDARRAAMARGGPSGSGTGQGSAGVSPSAALPLSVEEELALGAYRGTYEDYTEIVVQLGLVVLFSGVFPAAPLFAFVECALEMRLDALDLCRFLQRPTPDEADGIGSWGLCIRALLKAGLVVNFALLYFLDEGSGHWSLVRRASAFLVSVLVSWLIGELFWQLWPSESAAVRTTRARHEFLIDRYTGAATDDDKQSPTGTTSTNDSKSGRRGDAIDDGDAEAPDGDPHEATVAHYQERLDLLSRLDLAQRTAATPPPPPPTTVALQVADPGDKDRSWGGDDDDDDDDGDNEDDEVVEVIDADEAEEMIVGYFRDVRREASSASSSQPPTDERPSAAPAPAPTTTMTTTPTPPVAFERAALAGLDAIHAASARERFDFSQDSGWQGPESAAGPPRRPGAAGRRRWSLFARGGSGARVPAPIARGSGSGGDAAVPPPVVQLSGLDAVHEASRRERFDFSSGDPWHGSA